MHLHSDKAELDLGPARPAPARLAEASARLPWWPGAKRRPRPWSNYNALSATRPSYSSFVTKTPPRLLLRCSVSSVTAEANLSTHRSGPGWKTPSAPT